MILRFRALFFSGFALASFPVAAAEPVDEIVVTADPLRLIDLQASRSAYGLDLSYADTPRALSAISDETIARFNIKTVDDLVSVAPGTFTGSFFGVPGSVSLRGARADSYFRGFKRAENPGTFPTPIGASERIEIIRGPAPAYYGAGRIGGLVNVTPKTALTKRKLGENGRALELGATFGSYAKRVGEGSAGAAFKLGSYDAGVFAYGKYENSHSFYRGIEPKHALFQSAITLTDNRKFDLEIGGQWFTSKDYKQTIGWNRVTQDLIDNGNYITGRDTDLVDLNADGKLEPFEVDAVAGSFFGSSNIRQFIDFGIFPNAAFTLDNGAGAAALDPRTVFVADEDIANAQTGTAYADLSIVTGSDQKLRLQAFYDSLDADLYQSYGFAARYVADVMELRATYEASITVFGASLQNLFGVSWRRYVNETRQTFLSGYLVVDRRDLTVGATPTDIFDDPFSTDTNGIGWDTFLNSTTNDLGFFLISDIEFNDRLSGLVSARLDRFTASAINNGDTVFNPAYAGTPFSDNAVRASVEASLRYEFLSGASAYFTYAKTNALETNDAGGVEVDRIAERNFVSDSKLYEAGIKIGRRDVSASLAFYRQQRTRSDPFGNLDRETSKGVEAELHYLISDHWSATSAFTLQEARIGAPGVCGSGNGEFIVLPPSRLGVAPADGFGGLFAALNASCLPELQEGYRRRTTPSVLASGFLTYTSSETQTGVFGVTAGALYAGETGGKIQNAIRLPDYVIGKAAFFWAHENLSLNVSIDNLFDERFFVPVQNVYEEVGALPGRGREFSITLKARF